MAFEGPFHLDDLPLGDDGGMDAAPGMCPGSGGVCPDGGMPPSGDMGDGGMPPSGDTDGGGGGGSGGGMCPGSGGICPDGAAPPTGGMPPGGGMPPDGGTGEGGTGLDPSDIRSRFFLGGPTDIFGILAELDGRIGGINQQSAGASVPCLSAPPVPYTLTPLGQSVPFYAQCVQELSDSASGRQNFIQFGVNAGVVYLYESIGAGAIGARLTPPANGSGAYAVEAWMGVGYENASGCGKGNGFDDCSYGMMALEADAQRAHLELAVAGIGFGYCGAQLVSDGTTIYVQGSVDMGVMCGPNAGACVSASDVTATATCATTSFDLPAIGRAATSGPNGTWGASENGADGVVLNGTATDALGFGPSAPTPGVGMFMSMSSGGANGGTPDGGTPQMQPMGDGGAE